MSQKWRNGNLKHFTDEIFTEKKHSVRDSFLDGGMVYFTNNFKTLTG